MKLLLSALCASFMIAPASFAEDCEKSKCGKEKKEETLLVDCGKCKKDGDTEDEAEGALAGKCEKKKECEGEDAEGALAGCSKCKEDGDTEDEDEGALA